jgi:hypothetical protein
LKKANNDFCVVEEAVKRTVAAAEQKLEKILEPAPEFQR